MIKKVFNLKDRIKDINTEFEGISWKQLMSEVEKLDNVVEIWIERYDEHKQGGYVYTSQAFIGNSDQKLTHDDYQAAVDSII